MLQTDHPQLSSAGVPLAVGLVRAQGLGLDYIFIDILLLAGNSFDIKVLNLQKFDTEVLQNGVFKLV